MKDSIRWTEAHEEFWKKAGAFLLVFFLTVSLILAMLLSNEPYGESASTLLPAVSLSNHGSFRITEADLEDACALFPGHAYRLRLYYDTYLPEALAGGRYPFYLGVYAPLCVPALSVLRLLDLNPVYAFAITNALLFSAALWVVYRFANISAKKKLLAILLLGTSPIIRYINIQLYETALFSFVVMAMVFWFNRQRKLAALFLSIGGTNNPTIMAFGFFMILDYFLEMFRESNWSVKTFFKRFAADWKKTACLAACFLPCFVPFVLTRIGCGYWYIITNLGYGTTNGLGGRFLAYLFDLDLGLFPYFPVLMFLFAVISIRGGVHGRYDMPCTFFGALAVIAAFSLHANINSDMIGIARYNAWFCPIILLGTVYYMDDAFSGVWARRFFSGLTVLSCLWCVFVVTITAYSPNGGNWGWDWIAETVLEHAPGLYDPLPSIFTWNVDRNSNGGYTISEPVIYSNDEFYVCKVLVPPGMLDQAVEELAVPEEDEAAFEKQCAKIKRADKYYYLDFPAGTHIRKSIPYELGKTVGFSTESPEAHKYVVKGMSGPESISAWTEGHEMQLAFGLEDAPETDLQMQLDITGLYHAPQGITVSAGGTVLFDEVIEQSGAQQLLFTIPKEAFDGEVVVLTFEFPNAISPREVEGPGKDVRVIAFRIASFCVTPAGSGQAQ